MKLKKSVKIGLAAAGILCAALIIWFAWPKEDTKSEQTNSAVSTAESSVKENTKKETEETSAKEEQKDTATPVQENNHNTSLENTTVQDSTHYQIPAVSLPYTLPNSSLVAESIRSYDGLFVEDGSDTEVSGIAVLVLTNKGNTPVEYADIELNSGSASYRFTASAIAPGATVIVQEKDGKGYTGDSSYTCTTHIANINSFDYSDEVTITENEDSLTVTNVSGADIPCVRIFYKLYIEEEDLYVGGITYNAKITDLKADSSVTVTPSHYLKGYSEIMMVRTYDTAD